ncbi:3-ketoacyl-CoA thiolase [Altererythrobacter indicus]|uniref:3-ketoacyl-CoA thiolase n=1 Tax=Altericroceibacterium indicum TaxID=374177 RepID=A0A845ABX6_9SPHN|nr:3-ketoacyl-CoA thiolase [Altericroceibacterium indicum]MXP24678.1 3-ketoacyl-CoA thiolase [Altericroceibacterium indicum]
MALGKVAVVATAQTELRPLWGEAQHIDLISAVVTSVFKGSGFSIDDVDFVIDSGSDVLDGRSISNCGFLGALGAHRKEEARVEADGIWALQYGVNKIRSGASSVGLIVAYSKPSESLVENYWASQVEPFYQRPVGFSQRAAAGIQAQRYLADRGCSERDLAELAARRWADAKAHASVQIGDVPDAEAILASSESALPLTELMMARPVDGAVAMLIVDEPSARRAGNNPVFITGMGSGTDCHAYADRDPLKLASLEGAAAMAARAAGWSAKEADVVELSAHSVVGEMLAMDVLGLDEGKAAINRSGGALPADPIMATGLCRAAEAVRQLREPQLYGGGAPSRAVVHGAQGVGMQNNCVMTLEV